MLLYRVPEEFYGFEADPDALHNLIADAKSGEPAGRMRNEMLVWMGQTKEPLAKIAKPSSFEGRKSGAGW